MNDLLSVAVNARARTTMPFVNSSTGTVRSPG
jgi:hypothetical protein